MDGQNEGKQEKRQLNITTVIIIALLVILVIVAIVIAILLLRGKPEEEDSRGTVTAKGTIVTKDNVEELLMDEGAPVPDGYYDVSMSIDWHFKDGVTADAMVANKETNTRTVYFDLLTEDTEELVYSSPYIPVGESMQGFTLDKEMEPGEYDMIVRYHLVNDDNAEVSSLSVGVTIYIE